MNAGDRYRVAFCQDGQRTVGSVVMSDEEAHDAIFVEAMLHNAYGWDVIVYEPDRLLVQKQREDRLIKREVVIERYTPEGDTLL